MVQGFLESQNISADNTKKTQKESFLDTTDRDEHQQDYNSVFFSPVSRLGISEKKMQNIISETMFANVVKIAFNAKAAISYHHGLYDSVDGIGLD